MRYYIFIAYTMLCAICLSAAYAVTSTMNAGVAFSNGLIITKVADIDFGTLVAGVPADYRIDTNGTVTTSGLGVILSGPAHAGVATISGSTSQRIDITTGNFVADNGVALSLIRCKYDTGAERNCSSVTNLAAPGAGKTLRIGGRINVDGTQTPGMIAAPTFDVVVTYN